MLSYAVRGVRPSRAIECRRMDDSLRHRGRHLFFRAALETQIMSSGRSFMNARARSDRARQRAAESARAIEEHMVLIAKLRADGEDTSRAVKLLDELRVVHRRLLEQATNELLRAWRL